MNAHGFLGTNASLTADLSLVLGLLVALMLTLGVVVVRRRCLELHRWLQDDSFGGDVLRAGATFQQTFATPGTYLYYCDLHGGPGGVGMSARIEVR